MRAYAVFWLVDGRANADESSSDSSNKTEAPSGRQVRWRAVEEAPNRQTVSQTELAEDRTILASERTFAGWMRTSLGAVAIGIGFHALFGTVEPPWVPRSIATGFLLLSVLVIILAERRAAAVMRRLSAHVVESADVMNLRLFAAAVSLGAASLIAAIWLL